jgi:monofunctional glycosyltransferase
VGDGDRNDQGGSGLPNRPEDAVPPASSGHAPRPREWTPRAAATPGGLGLPPMPDLRPLGEEPDPFSSRRGTGPRFKPKEKGDAPKRPRKPLWRRALFLLLKLVLAFLLVSIGMVAIYRIVPPPITWTMIGDIVGGHGVTKRWMPISQIAPAMPRAAIAAEDSRFCTHNGFDFAAMGAAYLRNQQGGRIRGGSTISQQTAKNVFLWQGGGYFRKAMEAYFTVLIENIWGKRRIMEVYLNVAETGIGTYGVNAGSLRYFKHDASRLTPQEAARIAAVLPLPKKRAGIDPRGFTRRYGNSINARIGVVRNDGLDDCLH